MDSPNASSPCPPRSHLRRCQVGVWYGRRDAYARVEVEDHEIMYVTFNAQGRHEYWDIVEILREDACGVAVVGIATRTSSAIDGKAYRTGHVVKLKVDDVADCIHWVLKPLLRDFVHTAWGRVDDFL